MLSDIYLLSCNCLYSDLKFQPTHCPFPVPSGIDNFRPYYSGDKPCRILTVLPRLYFYHSAVVICSLCNFILFLS